MNNFVIITGIFDGNPYENNEDVNLNTNKRYRNTDKYISLFKYIYDLNIPTILYIESKNINKIKPRDNLIIIEKNIEDLINYKKIHDLEYKLNNIIYGNSYKYSAIVTSKFNLLEESKNYIINNNKKWESKHLIWLDSGIAHNRTILKNKFIKHINLHINDKIILNMLSATSKNEIINIDNFLSHDRLKLAGGLIICPWDKISWIYNKMNKLFDYSIYNIKKLCLEEQLLPIISTKYPNNFDYIYGEYSILENLKYITNGINMVIKNLQYCRINSIYDIGMKILNKILISIYNNNNKINKIQMCEILYEGQIISYYTNIELSKNLGFMIHYMYHNISYCKDILNKYNIKDNLKFININILDKNDGLNNILESDLSRYLWIIL